MISGQFLGNWRDLCVSSVWFHDQTLFEGYIFGVARGAVTSEAVGFRKFLGLIVLILGCGFFEVFFKDFGNSEVWESFQDKFGGINVFSNRYPVVTQTKY